MVKLPATSKRASTHRARFVDFRKVLMSFADFSELQSFNRDAGSN